MNHVRRMVLLQRAQLAVDDGCMVLVCDPKEILALVNLAGIVEDQAEGDCETNGQGCADTPRHGQCRPCRARQRLEAAGYAPDPDFPVRPWAGASP